jgi:tetratricopeptide (TPR) repeat protein
MRQALAVVAFLFLSVGAARGADHESARDHYVKGTRAYELGLYDEAIAEYMAAYKIKDDPALLFNIGQAHRLAGHNAEALRFYKTYLTKVPDASNRSEVETKMADLAKQIEREKQGVAPPTPPPSPVATPVGSEAVPATDAGLPSAPATAAPAVVAPPVTVAESAPAGTGGRGMRLAGILSAAGGLALVGTGIVFGVLAKQAADDLTELDRNRGIFDPAKEEAGQRDQLLAGIFAGAGAAAIATGVVLYVLGARDGEATSQALTISPSVGPHKAGATLRMVY